MSWKEILINYVKGLFDIKASERAQEKNASLCVFSEVLCKLLVPSLVYLIRTKMFS